MSKAIYITKASGQSVPFSSEKLSQSLLRSGASGETIQYIIDEVTRQLTPGMSTKKIYKLAFSLLKKQNKPAASKYQLRKAIMELGPSGYPFEKFVAEILKQRGYTVKVGEIMQGKCVTHEVDVVAERDNECFLVECKYHNLPGIICDVKIPLYIHARFNDVVDFWCKQSGHENKKHTGWVATNTKFSSDAIKYGQCAGLYLMSWDYPAKHSLKDQIDTYRLYPVTTLHSLSKYEKEKCLENGIILCKDLIGQENFLEDIGVKPNRITSILDEINNLLTNS